MPPAPALAQVSRPKPSGETLRFMQCLWDLVHALDVSSKRMARTLGVTGPQRLVIRVIGQSPALFAGEIAATLGMHPSTLTGIIRRLQTQHLVERAVDPTDRRRVRFRLTPRGQAIDRERKGTVEAAVRRALGRADGMLVTKTSQMLSLLVGELERLG